MPGTLLLDDWRQSVEDELRKHAQQAQQAFQVVGNPPPIQTPDPQQVLRELQGHAQQAAQQAQQGIVQFAQERQQNAQDVGQQLQDYATQAAQGVSQFAQPQLNQAAQPVVAGVQPFEQPRPPSEPLAGTALLQPPPGNTGGESLSASSAQSTQGGPSGQQWYDIARAQLSKPYIWGSQGGRSDFSTDPAGFDCSGFVSYVMKTGFGVDLPAFTGSAYQQTRALAPGEQPRAGDVVFYNMDSSDPHEQHIALYTGNGQIIQAGGTARDVNVANVNQPVGSAPEYRRPTALDNPAGNAAAQLSVAQVVHQGATTARGAVSDVLAGAQAKVGQGQQDFVSSLQPLAQQVADRTGIDPNALLAIAANETGWGRSQTAQQQNNLFSIQGPSGQASRWATYRSPKESFDAFVNLVSSAPRYAQAWLDRSDPVKFVDDLRNAGYVVDEPGFPAQGWVDQVKSIYRGLPPTDAGGPSPQRAAAAGSPVYDVGGERPAARAALYAGQMQPAGGDQPPAFQVIGDTAERARQTVGQAASDIGTAARGAVDATGEAIGGALSGAGEAIGGALSGLGTGAQQAATDFNQTGAANQLLRQGRTQAEQAEFGARQTEEAARLFAEQRRRDAESAGRPLDLGQVGQNAWNMIIGANPAQGITWDDYLGSQHDKNTWIENNNPLRDTLVLGGLTSGLAQQLTDPLMVATFGPTSGLGRVAGERVGERVGAAAAQRLNPAATQWLSSVADKFTSGAIIGGLQNALFVAEQPGATPLSVGQALLEGALLGGTIDAASPAAKAVVARVGQSIIDRAGEARPALEQVLRSRQRGEAEVGFAAGVPRRPEATEPGFRAPPEPAPEPARRMYHGGTSAFDRPDPGKFDPNGLYGPGYYLTSSPTVAGGLGKPGVEGLTGEGYAITRAIPEDIQQDIPAMQRNIAEQQATIKQMSDPSSRKLFGEARADAEIQSARAEIDDIQQRMDELVGTARDWSSGPNVRAVDVPQNVRLFDAEAPLDIDLLNRITSLLDPRDARALESSLPYKTAGAEKWTNDVLYRKLSDIVDPPYANKLLRDAGYDGIQYAGGGRVPMADAAGNPIEHTAHVIFPESLDKLRNAISGRQGGQAELPFSVNLGGAALGGYAGNLATPEDATPEERLRNIGLGATAGLVGTRAITRTLERRPGLLAATADASGGFRAPERPTLEDQVLQARTREPVGAPSREPRSLGEVESNPHLLREPGPSDRVMTDEDLSAHYDTLAERLNAVRERFLAVDEQVRNPNAKPERPPWAAGYTNDQLVHIARQHDVSAYEPNWWERAGLLAGSGEVRENVGQSGIARGMGQSEPTLADLRAERNRLAREERDILAGADQLSSAAPGQRFAVPPERGRVTGDLPFAGDQEATPHGPYATETAGPSGNLAQDMVTRNGTKPVPSQLSGLREEPGQVVGSKGGLTGRAILEPETVGQPSERAKRVMPNLDAMVGDDMPEVRAQIQQAVADNTELFEAYQQGRISHDSLVSDLATKVGMTAKDFLKTPVGKGFNTQEMVALQAAAIDSQHRQVQLAEEIMAKGGVENLSPEEVAYGLSSLLDAARLLPVATGARSTAGRTLNALKIRIDRAMAAGINASNERIVARRESDAARRGAVRAARLLEKTRDLEGEQKQALNGAREKGAPQHIVDQIAEAYDQLDRYQAMSLHEKGAEFDRLATQRAEAAAKRRESVRGRPEELLSALKAELKAEQDNFAKRKDTWETTAFWDTKANEQAINKRRAFRGGLYLEQQRKAAQLAEKGSETRAAKAWDLEQKRQTRQTDKASALLEAIGGEKPSRELLDNFVKAITSDDDMAAPKFLKGMQQQGWFGRSQIMRIAGLLSSTATGMINATGNVIQVPIEVVSHAGTIGIDWARAAATGGERQAYWAELGPMLEGYGPGFLAKLPEAIKILQTGITPAERADLGKIRAGFQSGSTKVDTAVEMPLRTLQASDELFRGGAFAMQANRVATRYATQEGFRGARRAGRMREIVSHLEDFPELYQEAQDAAARMVYQEKRTVPMPQAFGKGVPADIARGAVSQPLPFIKTPANITSQGFGLSPFGLAGVAEAIANRPNVRPERLGRQTLLAEQRLARTALGTAIFGGGVAMGSGVFTGGKSMLTGAYDEKEASTYPQGWREWSMRVEDQVTGNTYYVPLQNFGTAGVPLAMAAIVTDAGHRGKTLLDKDEMVRASTAIGAYVLDNTFLQGLSDSVNVLHDPSRYAPKFVESLVSSYGPYSSLGRQVQRAMGTASRNPREGLLGLVDALEANYPGLSAGVPESTTAIGEPRTQGISGAAAFALPIRADIERDQPTLKVLRENDIAIPAEPKELNVIGGSVELTEGERDQLKRARGAAIVEGVAAAQKSAQWARADATLRNEMLKSALNFATRRANDQFLAALGREEILRRRVTKAAPEPYYLAGVPE